MFYLICILIQSYYNLHKFDSFFKQNKFINLQNVVQCLIFVRFWLFYNSVCISVGKQLVVRSPGKYNSLAKHYLIWNLKKMIWMRCWDLFRQIVYTFSLFLMNFLSDFSLFVGASVNKPNPNFRGLGNESY